MTGLLLFQKRLVSVITKSCIERKYYNIIIFNNANSGDFSINFSVGVYFELNKVIYHNSSAVLITSIGEAESALFCKTDKKDCCKTAPNRYGEFYYPNGTRVPVELRQYGFYRNRDTQYIRLNRRERTTSPMGKYRCEIPDATGEKKNIYINLI